MQIFCERYENLKLPVRSSYPTVVTFCEYWRIFHYVDSDKQKDGAADPRLCKNRPGTALRQGIGQTRRPIHRV